MSRQLASAGLESFPLDAPGRPVQLYAFQSTLHRLLEGFLNDYFLSHSSRLLAPWRARYALGEVAGLGRQVLGIARPNSASNSSIDFSLPKDVARVIALGYRFLGEAMGEGGQGRRRLVRASQEFQPARYASLPEIVSLQRDLQALSNKLRAAYLFGSLADFEIAPGFSDVDCLIIFRREAMEEPEQLLEMRLELLHCLVHCYRLDPLQHHGFFCVAETDLAAYPEAFLALLLIERGCALLSNEPLSFHLRDDLVEARQSLARDLKFMQVLGRGVGPRNLFFMKLLVSSILLVPSLVLHARGRPTYKRDSFDPARPLFSAEAWQAVEIASKLRTLWPRSILPRPVLYSLSAWPSPHAIPLAARACRLSDPCRAALAGGLLESVARLVDEAWRYAGDENC
jgi:hypothetical protein